MLRCLSFQSTTTSLPNSPAATTTNLHNPPPPPPLSQGNSRDATPISSPTVNLTREYTLAVRTHSYAEMWSRIHVFYHDHHNDDADSLKMVLARVLQPNRESVDEALLRARRNTLTGLISDYFDHSETAIRLCLVLQQSVYRARALYHPLRELLDVLPLHSDSLSQSQCDCAFDAFLQFDRFDNPFPNPNSLSFQQMHSTFLQLKKQLDRRLYKSRSRVRIAHRATAASALCLIGSVAAVAVSAAVIASHAFVAIVATPLCAVAHLPWNLTKRELAHAKQLEAAAKGTYVLNNDLHTIDRLVGRLYAAVEGDKQLIRLGLERGKNKHPILEVSKQLHKTHSNLILQLKDLEEHICLSFNAVNRARSLLLQEIHLYQTSNSSPNS